MSRALVFLLVPLSCAVSHGALVAFPAGIPPEFVDSSVLYQLCSNTDFDADGDTDGSDVLQWQRKLGAGASPLAPQSFGDANNDFKVASTDLQLWRARVGTPSSMIADAVCFKLFFDPKGIIDGQVTAFIDVPNVGAGNRLAEGFVFTHPEYDARIIGTTITPSPIGQRYEYKIEFNATNPTNPPGGQIVIFGLEIPDAKPQLGVANIQPGAVGFKFDPGDFVTVFNPMGPPPQTETFNDTQLQDVPLTLAVPLALNVDTVTGAVSMQNFFGLPLSIKYYEITSASSALNFSGWVSFQDSLPGGGWVEAGGSGSGALGESNLGSSLSLLNGDLRSLGNAFNAALGTRDLKFTFVKSDNTLLQGVVNYSDSTPIAVVPEPGCLVLYLLGLAGTVVRRRLTRRELVA